MKTERIESIVYFICDFSGSFFIESFHQGIGGFTVHTTNRMVNAYKFYSKQSAIQFIQDNHLDHSTVMEVLIETDFHGVLIAREDI